MSVGLNASQARAKSQQDMIIFDEVDAIMREVIRQSGNGQFEAVVEDGTTMTESTPVTTLYGSVQDPSVVVGETLIIDGNTIVLGTTARNLNGIIADINDANIAGISASKIDNYLVITITHAQQATWTYEIGAGTANASLGLSEGVYTANNPDSVDYFSVWQGTVVDRAIAQQMDTVTKHFNNLGYKIDRIANTRTNKTFKWYVYW